MKYIKLTFQLKSLPKTADGQEKLSLVYEILFDKLIELKKSEAKKTLENQQKPLYSVGMGTRSHP